MNKDQHTDIDKLFQDAFGKFEVTPPPNMWNKIETSLPLTETDSLFKNALENYEKQPSSGVWNNIEPELPLSLTIRNAFIHLSKIAAVLLVGITLYVFTQQSDWSSNDNIVQQETVAPGDINNQQSEGTEDVVSVDDLLANEPIAMAELKQDLINSNRPSTTPTVREENGQVNPNSPFSNPINTVKDGNIGRYYPNEVTININEIARRVKNGDKDRIPSAELYSLVLLEEEQSSKMDTLTKVQKEEMSKEMKALKNKKMEDVIADNGMIYFDGKIRRPKSSSDQPVTGSTAAKPYLSLQGAADESMVGSGMRFNRSRGFASKIFRFIK
ncbi:MAG: hypothetical protein ACI97N_000175 [Cognaticolwellia sp.]|jgi:hypothetical protein